MSQITYVVSKAIKLDEIEYSFSIYRNDDRFMGLWNCKLCDRHEMVALIQPNVELAERLSKEQINQHHKAVHEALREQVEELRKMVSGARPKNNYQNKT